MITRISGPCLLLLAFVVLVVKATASSRRTTKRPIQIINDGKTPIRVYWVNVETREEILMSNEGGVMPGTDMPLEYVCLLCPMPRGRGYFLVESARTGHTVFRGC
jgi:hypothetical protein